MNKKQFMKIVCDPANVDKIADGKYVPVRPLPIDPVRVPVIKPVWIPEVK